MQVPACVYIFLHPDCDEKDIVRLPPFGTRILPFNYPQLLLVDTPLCQSRAGRLGRQL